MLKISLSIWLLACLSAFASAGIRLITSEAFISPTVQSTARSTSNEKAPAPSTTTQNAVRTLSRSSTAVPISMKTPSSTSLADPTKGNTDGSLTSQPSTPASSVATGLNAASAASGGSTSTAIYSSSDHSSGGLTSAEKAGVGVGVGVGIPLIAGAIALIFFLRRRRSNRYGPSGPSASELRGQPAMSSAAPALAGASELGRAPSQHSLPRSASHRSLEVATASAPDPTIVPPSQHSLGRAPSQHSVGPMSPEQQSLMTPAPAYDEAPSPMQEYREEPEPEPVSPVSPVSPMGSRPPSPMERLDD